MKGGRRKILRYSHLNWRKTCDLWDVRRDRSVIENRGNAVLSKNRKIIKDTSKGFHSFENGEGVTFSFVSTKPRESIAPFPYYLSPLRTSLMATIARRSATPVSTVKRSLITVYMVDSSLVSSSIVFECRIYHKNI